MDKGNEEANEAVQASLATALPKTGPSSSLPGVQQILLDQPLYAPMPTTDRDRPTLEKLREINFQIDAYCISCEMMTVFKTLRPPVNNAGRRSIASMKEWEDDPVTKPGSFNFSVSCQRCRRGYTYYFSLVNKVLIKVGQYPSMEDILSSDLLRYKGVLRSEDYVELRRATGLISHGIGIGSFVYLRRIFERLINIHHAELEGKEGDIEGFATLHMDEKIAALSSVLPEALVENKAIYRILSFGIHALDEDTCREYFPLVKAGIMEILEQDLANRERKAASADLKKKVAAVAGKLKAHLATPSTQE